MTGGVYATSAPHSTYNGNSCLTVTDGAIVVDTTSQANGNKSCLNVTNGVTGHLASSARATSHLDE